MQAEARTQQQHDRFATSLGWLSIALGTVELAAPHRLARTLGLSDDPRVASILRVFGARGIMSGLAILTRPDRSSGAWSRVGGDAMDLALLSSAATSDGTDRRRIALATVAVAGVTALDVVCARALTSEANGTARARRLPGVTVKRAVTIRKPIDAVYRFWKQYENLPRFMRHLESVEVLDERRSRWTAKGPAGTYVRWVAETTVDRENEWIAWRSLEGADVQNAGSVRFALAPADRGTEVRIELHYEPPAGSVGRGLAWIFGEEPGQQIHEDLHRFKQLMETGQIPLSEGFGLWRPAQPAADASEISERAGVHL